MSAASSKSILWFLAGVAAASIFWIFFRTGPSEKLPATATECPKDHSATWKAKRSDLTKNKGVLPLPDEAALAGPASTGARWIDAANGITAEHERARAQRQFTRVTLARVQRHLAAAPVRPEDMGQLLDLLSYKLNMKYEFSRRSMISGLPTKGDDYDRRLALEEARLDAEIKGVVGESNFNEMMNSFRKLDDRLYGVEFIGEALAQGEPLASEQRKKLNEIINRLDPRAARGIGEAAPDPDTGLTSYDLEVAKALEGILSPQQLRIFREVRADWNLFWEAKRIHGPTKGK